MCWLFMLGHLEMAQYILINREKSFHCLKVQSFDLMNGVGFNYSNTGREEIMKCKQ